MNKKNLQQRLESNKLSENILEMWRKEQCDDCKNGDYLKCTATKKDAMAVRIEPDGTTYYYCFIGCLMLQLDDKARKELIELQVNIEGHYQKLANP